jgi:hypothetical protein
MAMLRDQAALVRAMDARLSDLDALVLPTTPIVASLKSRAAKASPLKMGWSFAILRSSIFLISVQFHFPCRARVGCRLD